MFSFGWLFLWLVSETIVMSPKEEMDFKEVQQDVAKDGIKCQPSR